MLNAAVKPVAVLFKDVTVKPEVAMAALVPVIVMGLDDSASVAVIVWLPAVFKVMGNVPIPALNVASPGRVALASLLLRWTLPV